jgi:uncharacterized repeat protein (TIGR03803 family)
MKLTLQAAGIVLACALVAGCARAGGPVVMPSEASSLSIAPNAGFSLIYTFKGPPDAAVPAAGLIPSNGMLYGTSQVGGKGNAGTVFATSTAGKERVVHDFGSSGDGVDPSAGLVVISGAFYGTTTSGGHGFGTVFKIGKTGNESVLYNFKGGSDGSQPYARLVVHNGVLYGTTYVGGGSANCGPQGCGTVFSVTTSGKEKVLHAFKNGSDGWGPVAPLVVVNSTLYGTTGGGGKNGSGTIFKCSTSGNEQILHNFGESLDGSEPEAGLVTLGGKLYGTTNTGGKNSQGTVFSASIAGGEHVLYSFKGGPGDGANPEANLVTYNGKLYGTTAGGGSAGQGTVFAVGTGGGETVLHAFKSAEGSDPRAPVVVLSGQLYGTTSLGAAGGGTIFKASP